MTHLYSAGKWLLAAGLLFVLPLLFERGFTEQFTYPKLVFTEVLLLAALPLVVAALTSRAPEGNHVAGASRWRRMTPALVFCGIVVLAGMRSATPWFSLRRMPYLLCGPAWLCILIVLDARGAAARGADGGTRPPISWMARLSSFAGVFVAAIALAQWAGLDPMIAGSAFVDWGQMAPRMRLYSTFGNPDFVAGFLIGVVFLTSAQAIAAGTRARGVAWGCVTAALIFAITGAGSFGGWAGLAAGCAVFGVVWFRGERTSPQAPLEPGWKRVAAMALAAILILGGVALSAARRATGADIFSTLESRVAGRIYLARVAWPLFARHPLLGSGPGAVELQFLDLQGQYLAAHPVSTPFWSNVVELHNDPLQLLLETGLLGCMAFAWMLLGWCAELRRALASSRSNATRAWLAASAGGVAAILVDSVFDFQFAIAPTWILLFTLLAFPFLLAGEVPGRATASGARRRLPPLALGVATALALAVAAAGIATVARFALAERRYATGYGLEEKDAYAAAERSYRDGLQLDARNGRLHFGLARVLYLEDRCPEALREVGLAQQTYSDSHLEVLRARIEDQMGASGVALADYRRALWLDPTLQSVHGDIARLEK